MRVLAGLLFTPALYGLRHKLYWLNWAKSQNAIRQYPQQVLVHMVVSIIAKQCKGSPHCPNFMDMTTSLVNVARFCHIQAMTVSMCGCLLGCECKWTMPLQVYKSSVDLPCVIYGSQRNLKKELTLRHTEESRSTEIL